MKVPSHCVFLACWCWLVCVCMCGWWHWHSYENSYNENYSGCRTINVYHQQVNTSVLMLTHKQYVLCVPASALSVFYTNEIKSKRCCYKTPHTTFTNSFAVENLRLNVKKVWIYLDINARDPSFILRRCGCWVDISSNCWLCVHLFVVLPTGFFRWMR